MQKAPLNSDFPKNFRFLGFWVCLLAGFWSCQTVSEISEGAPPSIEFNWQRKNFHPVLSIPERNKDSVCYAFSLPSSDFMPGSNTQLLVKFTIQTQKEEYVVQKKFLVPNAGSNTHFFNGTIYIPTDSLTVSGRVLFKEINTIRQEEFSLCYLPDPLGPVWKEGLHHQIVDANEPLSFPSKIPLKMALRSEKLPSPPFSSSAPFIPNEFSTVSSDSLAVIWKDKKNKNVTIQFEQNSQLTFLHCYQQPKYTTFPFIQFQADLVGPVRYLCSKDEFDKIQRSNEGAENQLEKFWITCGGGKDKGRELIQLYYRRVEDANIYFTHYADGWRTDRGMIYLVFGHPHQIVEQADRQIWYYGAQADPSTLQFIFNKKQHDIWGTYYLLERKEEYRNAWEYQVTAWRQGKIFD
jgi:GWxTD domain-containing protein